MKPLSFSIALLLYYLPLSVTAQTVSNTLFSDYEIQQKQIDQIKPVGVIDGTASVTLTGAATYAIPVKCPPGTNGMQPTLAISYSSQSGNGIMGMGWNISGLSAITRSPKNLYHDGLVRPITNTSNDVFALDGSRLIPVSGSGPNFRGLQLMKMAI